MDILSTRLSNHHLLGDKFKTPEEVVGWLGAVQSQDFQPAKWCLGLRMKNPSDEEITKAFNEGRILRTHVMRPTWHFVPAEDILWMQDLTSQRVKKLMTYYEKRLEITEDLLEKTNKIITQALSNKNFLTRLELKTILSDSKIKADTQRLGHIVSTAELDGLIASGPLRDKQHTYALITDRAPQAKHLDRDAALATIALRYFQSHGPAQIKDFAWWSGLTMKESSEGLASIKSRVEKMTKEGKDYYFIGSENINSDKSAFVFSVYDEYFIGYTDRSLIMDEENKKKMAAVGNALLTSLIVINGKIEGSWKRKLKKDKIEIKLNTFRNLNLSEKSQVNEAVKDYEKFLGLPVTLL